MQANDSIQRIRCHHNRCHLSKARQSRRSTRDFDLTDLALPSASQCVDRKLHQCLYLSIMGSSFCMRLAIGFLVCGCLRQRFTCRTAQRLIRHCSGKGERLSRPLSVAIDRRQSRLVRQLLGAQAFTCTIEQLVEA